MRFTLVLAACVAAISALTAQEDAPKKPAAPQVGDAAPAFRLNDHRGEAVAVGGKHRRWTVLAFYPKALTPG